jgi:hypothetical protein
MAAKRRTFGGDTGTERLSRKTLGADQVPERFRWEEEKFEDAHAAATKWADHVRDRPSAVQRRKQNLLYASIYQNLPLLGFGVNTYTKSVQHQGRISVNVTQNAIDSLVSKLCKNRPRPMFQTSEGPFELQVAAENADKYADGRFYQLRYYQDVHPGKVLDMCIYGLGVSKIHDVDGEAVIERAYPWEIISDDRECMYGSPVRIGQRKYYDTQEVWDLWRREGKTKADKEWNEDLYEVINGATAETDRVDFDRDETSDQILVYDFYREPTAKRRGKKLVCIRGKTLRFDDCDGHPFNFLRPGPTSMGLYGTGICERVEGIQREINRLVRDIQMAMHLIAKPHWMVEASSNVNTASLNNDMATIIKYSGAVPPTVYTPQSMSAEVFQHLQYLVRTLYEVTGISQLSAQSQKPAGLSSAVAMRTYLNVETERFSDTLRNVEEGAAEDAHRLAIVEARIGGKKTVLSPGHAMKGGRVLPKAERPKWTEKEMKDIRVQVYPTSKMPDTPAGKREYALELAQYTKVTLDDVYEILEWGDTEAFAKRRLAGKRNVERDIAKMRRGEKVIRDAIGNHRMAFDMVTDAYEEAKGEGLPENRLAMMRNYIKACYQYLTGQAWNPKGLNPLPAPGEPMPPMGGPAPMMPPGAPAPPPAPMGNGGLPPAPQGAAA